MQYPLTGWNQLGAPAGAGKTAEARQVVTSLVERGMALSDIAGMSFTRVGSATLADRIDGATRDDLRHFRTIHSMCYRLLDLTPKQVLREPEVKAFFHDELRLDYTASGRSSDPDEYVPGKQAHSTGGAFLAFLEWQRNRMLPFDQAFKHYYPTPELLPFWKLSVMQRFAQRYDDFKASKGVLDFTDMLMNCLDEGLQLPTRAMLVDEFQDCTSLQVELIKHWGQSQELVFTFGDDDQQLYSFLGAVPRDFLEFPAERFLLDTNHRSGEKIVDFSRRLIQRNKNRVQKTILSERDGGIVRMIPMLPRLDTSRSTFILARTHYLLAPLARELEQRGIPFTMRSGSLGIPQGKPPPAFAAFRAMQALNAGRQVTPLQLRDLYSFIRNTANTAYTERGAKKKIETLAVQSAHDQQSDLFISLNDLPHFGAFPALIDAITRGDAGLLNRADPQRISYWRRMVRQYGADVLYEKPNITLSTIHGVKGDEADIVYLLPDISARIAEAMARSREERESERRVWYVAATRARDALYVLQPQTALRYDDVLQRGAA